MLLARAFFFERVDVRVDLRRIFFTGVFGRDIHGVFGLHVHQQQWFFECRTDLLGVEDMEQHQIVAVESQRRHGVDDDFRLFVEIGDHHHDAAPPVELLEMNERLREIGAGAEFGFFYRVRDAHELALARGGLDVVAHVVVEDDYAGGIALLIGQ